MRIPRSVEALVRAWEQADRTRARWEQAFHEPYPSLEDQFLARDRIQGEQEPLEENGQ
jgi:hypothetical protein